MVRIEFTVEPFVEGQPGEHVTAAIDAVRDLATEVEVGPFGTSCDVDVPAVGDIVKAVTDAAIAHGATHVAINVAAHDEDVDS